MTGPWTQVETAPSWLWDLEPVTTGLLGQEGVRFWVQGRRAVGIRARGVVYPVWAEGSSEAGLGEVLAHVAENWCLMGPADWVTRAEASMPRSSISHRVPYQFLVRPSTPLEVPTGPGVVRVATPRDGSALYPLQAAYEREEVLFDPREFQGLVVRLHLGKLLRTQILVGLWIDGKAVAKAGTNALTPRWAQIGGVFTRPSDRRRGLQKRLMSYLLAHLAAQGRGACLFVKSQNQAALALYSDLGFEPAGDFLITYGSRL